MRLNFSSLSFCVQDGVLKPWNSFDHLLTNIHFPLAQGSAFDVSSSPFLIFANEISRSGSDILPSAHVTCFLSFLLTGYTFRNGQLSLLCLTVNRIRTAFLASSIKWWKEKEKPETVLHFSIPVCSVIVNAEEWRYFKDLTKTCTPLEVEMFHMKEDSLTPQVYLRPRESVHIPLKYQSFVSGHILLSQVSFLSATLIFFSFLRQSVCKMHIKRTVFL